MAITDHTRKILWALSGNQCAMCSQRVIEDATHADPEAVVGRECHIISDKEKGPRYDPAYPKAEIDSAANLLLLCPTHHVLVDAQDSTYRAEDLRTVKRAHEDRVRAQQTGAGFLPKIRFIRSQDAIPKELKRLSTGKELLNLVESPHAMYYNHPPVLTQGDADLFGGFGQDLEDWGMLLSNGELRIRVDAELALGKVLRELLSEGCVVFGAMERQRLEGGVQGPDDWYVAHITIARIDDPSIVWSNKDDS